MDPVHTVHQYCPSAKSFKVYLYKFSSAQLGTNPISLYLVLVNTPSSPGVWEPHSLIQTDLSGALWPAASSAFYTPGTFCSWLQSCHKEESNKVNSEKNVLLSLQEYKVKGFSALLQTQLPVLSSLLTKIKLTEYINMFFGLKM